MPELNNLNGFTVFVEGARPVGILKSAKHPDIVEKTREIKADYLAAQDVGLGSLEKMVFELEIEGIKPELMARVGTHIENLTIRAVARDPNDAVSPVKVTVSGRLTKLESGEWKSDEDNSQKYSITVRRYVYTVAGKDVIEVDAVNRVWKQNGKDMLAEINAALGV
jgi:P2 family phage contractile tail tube protein